MFKALTPNDIFNSAGKTCNVLTYPELSKFKKVDDIFKYGNSLYGLLKPNLPFDDNSCILLYMSKPNFGHWCIINRHQKKGKTTRIDFLDSYGNMIDDQLDFINDDFREDSNQLKAHLSRLLSNAKVPVHFNDVQMQVLDGKISTCGRYVSLFLKHNDLTVEDFVNTLTKSSDIFKIPIDELVTFLTR
jgi:hypothetical protein